MKESPNWSGGLQGNKGLWIGTDQISRNAADFNRVVKQVCVPLEQQTGPAFASADVEDGIALCDPLALEIVGAMIEDYALHAFYDTAGLKANIDLRIGVIAAMSDLCAGRLDGDYAEAAARIPPTLGYCKSLSVLFDTDLAAEAGGSGAFDPVETIWTHLEDSNPWTGNVFVLAEGRSLSEALAAVTPFRGECAGALQLSILTGCHSALGAEAVDALTPVYGPAHIGTWWYPLGPGKAAAHGTPTAATAFMMTMMPVPKEYTRGAVLAVPGDYLYFSKKSDYPKLAGEAGAWQGENCLYMGSAALGAPHYSGMGLGWKTEFALRMFLGNAYLNDCNAGFVAALRKGQTPAMPCRIVENPAEQIRFVERAILRYPDLNPALPKGLEDIDGPQDSLVSDDPRRDLLDLHFRAGAGDLLERKGVSVQHLMDGIGFRFADLREIPSSGVMAPALAVQLKDRQLVLRCADPAQAISNPKAMVNAFSFSRASPPLILT